MPSYQDQSAGNRHFYPLSNADNKYKGRIIFQPREIETGKIVDQLIDYVGGTFIPKSNESTDDTSSDNVDQRQKQNTKSIIDTVGKEAFTSFQGLRRNMMNGSGISPHRYNLDSVSLYLPSKIEISDQTNYNNINLGVIGASGELLGSEGWKGKAALIDSISQMSGDAKVAAATVAANTFIQGVTLGGVLGGDAIQGAISSSTQFTANPNTRTLFKSVAIRNFTFSFNLFARSKEENVAIKNIIKTFRKELYPEAITLDGGGNGVSIAYKYPNVFDIAMAYDEQQVGTRLLPSYLTSFKAVYNDNGSAFHEDGSPNDVTITASFMEATTLHKKRIESEGY